MGERLFVVSILFILFVLFEFYTFSGIRSIFGESRFWKYINIAYIVQSIFVVFSFYQMFTGMQSGALMRTASINLWLGIVLTNFVTKLIFCALLFVQDGGRFAIGIFNFGVSKFTESNGADFIPSRRSFLTNTSLAIASIPFLGMFYGMAIGKYKYTIKNVQLAFKDLPKSFDGFKIVQISDVHSGSFDDKDAVKKGIELINKQGADLLLFTGDLINSQKDEINPYIDLFASLTAKHGKYAVLGNHDYYGFYNEPESTKKTYWEDFMSKFKSMGFTLLNNENTFIEKGAEKICLAGVENWGAGRHFPKHGDLPKALVGVKKDDFTVLMSHDPSHWDHHTLPDEKHVHLTLSGHTHGMQFGIDIPGFKWSPVKYRYPRWSGLYEEKGQYLYVNRGFGFLAFPGRVGMWPEITVIELKSIS
jgi:uncharacterized protein